MSSAPTTFETERLKLRHWTAEDFAPFAELNADSRVMEYFPAPLSHTESDAMAIQIQALIEKRGFGFWATEIRSTGEFIGFVGLQVPIAELPFSPCVEIGWRLAYAHWGKGYATEAAAGALRVGFEKFNLPEIVSFTPVLNKRSQAVMEKLNMRADGIFEHPAVPPDHKLRPHRLYRLTFTDWQNHFPHA